MNKIRKILDQCVTPHDLDITKGTIVPPPGGWKNQSWYAVDVSFSATNPIHEGIIYTGFWIGAYSFVITTDGEPESIRSAYYIKGIRKLDIKG